MPPPSLPTQKKVAYGMLKKLADIAMKQNFLLILTSAVIGFVGLSFRPEWSPLILAVPVLWTLASTRYAAFAVMLGYNLTISRGLFHGAAVFLSEIHTPTEAAMLWFLMSLGVSLPFGVFWSDKKGWKAAGITAVFFIAYVVPPVALIGIVNPLMATGTIFKGWGFAGLAIMLVIYATCALSRRTALCFLCIIAMFTVLPDCSWYEPVLPEGITAIDTSFGRMGSGSFNFTRDYERANMVFTELRKRFGRENSADIIILPETIAGRLNRTGLELWKSEIERLAEDDIAVIFGAELPTGDGRKYDNAAVMLHKGKFSFAVQRIPVLYSMYRGPFSSAGANLHWLDDGILELPDNRKAAVVICYEAFLTWPYLASMIHRPDLIISMSNLWWCRETSLPASQRRAVSLWASLFGVPHVFAWNI
jgi:apolipoprotein N-acyltransferase